jgi:hypothetical protein
VNATTPVEVVKPEVEVVSPNKKSKKVVIKQPSAPVEVVNSTEPEVEVVSPTPKVKKVVVRQPSVQPVVTPSETPVVEQTV